MEHVFAQVPLDDPAIRVSPFQDFGSLVNIIVKNAFVFAGIITFFLLVFGGLSVIMGAGAGDSKKMESGKKTITGAVIGLLVVFAAYWIIEILQKITGIKLLGL
jgi:hypothetical protein